ncbi:MAG: ribose-phosphate pyrophosphokinase [Nanoarchaeota archaeon]|nr:ribose-phosphate pyrophosphokinase [Nanoarchaeota archaeon]
MYKGIKLICGTTHPQLGKDIADELKMPLTSITLKRFKDSEIYAKINEKIRGEDVFIIQPTCSPVNDSLMELLIMIDAAKRASAGRINAVIPYFGYSRQDRKATAREPITAKLVANMLTAAGVDRVITVDLHADQIQGFFDIPLDHFPGYLLLNDYFRKKKIQNLVAVSPDTGAVKKVRRFAQCMHIPLAIIDKRRPEHNKVEIDFVIGDVNGKNVVLMDDIIDTAGTITSAANALKEKGAKEIFVCATHAVLSDNASQRLQESAATEVLFTDTIPIPEENRFSKLKILSVAPLMADVIRNIHDNQSLGKLFSTYYD